MKSRTNKTNSSKLVAIIVPIYKKSLSGSEQISMRHLFHFLGKYDKYIIAPQKLELDYPDFKIVRFKKKYFRNINTYSKLLLTSNFYKKFDDYKYILIYQSDALVFSDQLQEWCDKEYDYIGAPWITSEMKKIFTKYNKPDHCGNGGFSLRNVKNCINVLNNAQKTPHDILKEIILEEKNLFRKKERKIKEYLKIIKKTWNSSSVLRYKYNEDGFWSFEAKQYYSNFKIAPVNISLLFAFEVGPRYCFKKNNYKLPFGCHAWEKYDKKFWLPYILKD